MYDAENVQIKFSRLRRHLKEFISDIYPKEVTISKTTESTSVASYLDMLFTRDKRNNITIELYEKRDAFGFHIVNFPIMSSNIPSAHIIIIWLVSMQLSSFAMLIVAQIIMTLYDATGT